MTDTFFMQRCLDLALLGLGSVAPNPPVGAVIVYEGRIIGEGYHRGFGLAHAEPNAIASVSPQDKHLLPFATLYVSLEPCSHYGKTPPCCDLVIATGFRRVVIALGDPFELVDGRGIARLLSAGILVDTGVLSIEASWVMRRFLLYHRQHRPYIILKWAQTADGFFAPIGDEQKWISNSFAKRLSHRWRTEEQSILVGTDTVLVDNPELTARLWAGRQPCRLVFDRCLRLRDKALHLFDGRVTTIVFTQKELLGDVKDGDNLRYVGLDFGGDVLWQLLGYLYEQKIQSVIVEGGMALLNSFIDAGLWDEARVFVAPVYWGVGRAAPVLRGAKLREKQEIGDNCLNVFVNEVQLQKNAVSLPVDN